MSHLDAIAAVGGVLVRWDAKNRRTTGDWSSPDGALTLGSATVEGIAIAGRGTFQAWRPTTKLYGTNLTEAAPVVFRLTLPLERLTQWTVFIRDRYTAEKCGDACLGVVMAANEAEARRVAVLAGLVVTSNPDYLTVVEIPINLVGPQP